MKRIIAATAGAALAVALAGCKDEPKPPNLAPPSQPNASDLFDKKASPEPGKAKGPAPG
jgi:hypothetical protein